MQMQQRAEAGIKEVILGYVGHEDELDQSVDLPTVSEVVGGFEGPVKAMSLEELPDDVRSVLLAENHRLTTGKTLKSADFKVREA